ncbi:hypothetical protein A2U01_0065724, partial [Trifolium medium]|nr:hypothetical protein [Trifolium medium]
RIFELESTTQNPARHNPRRTHRNDVIGITEKLSRTPSERCYIVVGWLGTGGNDSANRYGNLAKVTA